MTATKQWIEDLELLDLIELQIKYQDKAPKDQRSLNQLKRYYRKTGTMERLRDEPKEAPIGRLKNRWDVSAFNREAGEWTTTQNSSYEYLVDNSEIFADWKPATPARITPSRRKPIQRDHEVLLAFGDMQVDYRRIDDELIPIHDVAAINALKLLAKDLQPEELINLGDTVDLSGLSRFAKDSDHFYRTLGPSFQYVHDFYAQLRSDNPNAKITEIDSNHHKRLTDFVLKNMPDFYGVRQAGSTDDYPVFTYPYLTNLKHVGVDWVGGYGAAEYIRRDKDGNPKPDLAFIHGEFAVSSGSTAAKLSRANPDRNIVQGHKHSMESHYRTTRAGKYLGAMVVGALCRLDGAVPSYHSSIDTYGIPVHYQENWQNGAMVVEDYGEGNYQFNHIPIKDGKLFYKGKEYNGNL